MIKKATIKSIKKERIVKTGERFLDVEIELRGAPTRTARKGKVLEVIRWGYPYGTSDKTIKGDLKRLIATKNKETQQAEVSAKADAEEAKANKTITNIDGLEVKA